MNKIKNTLLLALILLAGSASAQELPMPSPTSTLTQRIGLTDISITYSRPSMKGRMIWGDLVPMDKIWRTGANKATKISFSNDVKILEKPVAAGEYSVFTIPADGIWTLILNSDLELWGTGDYDSLKDVLRVELPVDVNPMQAETMTFYFDNLSSDGGVLYLTWAELRIPIVISTNDHEIAMKNIEKAIAENEKNEYGPYINAANYLNGKGMSKQAIEYAEKGVNLSDYWYAHWSLAKIYGDAQKWDDAVASANMAKSKGMETYKEKGRDFSPYEKDIDKKIAQWKADKKAKK